jgi:hypothetical protein
MAKYNSGGFTPRNPKKYKGDIKKIRYRSSWELRMMIECDLNPKILAWSSEEVVIPYLYELDGQVHRYYMDIWLRMKRHDGKIVEKIIEIKPYVQTIEPKPQKRKTKQYIAKCAEWVKNQNKWTAARQYAKMNNMEFQIFTEHQLGIHK